MNSYLLLIVALIIPLKGFAAANSTTVSMSFDDCIVRREHVINQLGVSPRDIIPIVNTGIMTMTKICTVDGSLIVTCSKPDKKMILTKSTNSCR